MNDKIRSVVKDIPPSIVVFLIALPISMGIARASGMPASLGLITAVVGGVIVGFLGGAPLIIAGPSAGLSVLLLDWVVAFRTDDDPYGIASIGIVVILAGLIQTSAGLLKFGTYFRAVSPAVIRGMLAGIGIIIVAKQFHVMIDDDIQGSVVHNIFEIPSGVMKAMTTGGDRTHYIAASIGVATLLTIFLWERFRPAKLHVLPGALAGVLVATTAAAWLKLPIDYVDVTGSLASHVTLPTLDSVSKFLEPKVWTAAAALAFVGSAETLLCATAISRMHQGDRTDYDRELAAQGIGNLACGLLGALPITGVISRSSANVEAGAKTGASSVMQAIWVFLFATLLPGLLGLVPESALAAILIYVGFRLVQLSTPRNILDFGRAVVGIYLATVIGIVAIDLLSGIILGLVLSTGALVYSLAHLDIHRVDLDDKIELHLHGAATFVSLPSFAGAFEEIPPGSELHLCFDELDYVDHACLDFIAAFQLRHEETGGSVIVEWPSLMGRYTRGGIRAARRSIAPTRSGTDDD